MNILKSKKELSTDEIISYSDLVSEEGQNLQKGMNYKVKSTYSVFLMSVRKNAPYDDSIDIKTNSIIYEGHDAQSNHTRNPKEEDQPLFTPNGSLTANGKFFIEAQSFKLKIIGEPHKIKIYEKISDGVWCYKGFFNLNDAKYVSTGVRKVFKFYLEPIELKSFHRTEIIPFNRVIPTQVKVLVWARDKGKCVECSATENLHYDHDLPFSKGGTSYSEKNVRILCMNCNLKKSNKILSVVFV